jgi:hypothetical protein
VLFHCKPVNQQKTSIFALILCEEQRLNRFWCEKRCRNSTFTFGPPKSVLPSLFNTYLVMWKYNCKPLWLEPPSCQTKNLVAHGIGDTALIHFKITETFYFLLKLDLLSIKSLKILQTLTILCLSSSKSDN